MSGLDLSRLVRTLDQGGLTAAVARLAATLRRGAEHQDDLFLVGTPTDEPWHLAAHLDDSARFAGLDHLRPTLVRHEPRPNAPTHLAHGLASLAQANRHHAILVIAPTAPGEALLTRLDDARRAGACILAIDGGDPDLRDLANDALVITEPLLVGAPPSGPMAAPGLAAPRLAAPNGLGALHLFDASQHAVAAIAGQPLAGTGRRSWWRSS
jgi:hypothetical protein